MLMNNKSILFIDDVESVRDSMVHDLEQRGYVVETAVNGEEGVRKFKSNPADLVITDLMMGEMDGIQLSKIVREINPSTKVIIHTGFPTTPSAINALKLGVSDYLLKPCPIKDMLKSIEKCLSSESKEDLIKSEVKISSQTLEEAGLSAREIEVCYLIKLGMTNAEVASKLFISVNTAKNHIKRIHMKLKVANRPQLVSLLHQEF